MIGVREAVHAILDGASPLDAEHVPVAHAAGRVVAEPVRARLELPPWDNAAMDGYAVRSSDLAGTSGDRPVVLRVLETVAAGGFPAHSVEPGTATRIMTGAPLPSGADSVIRVEDTDGGVEQVRVCSARDAGRNIRPRGEDARPGDEILPAGAVVEPWAVGALAAVGSTHVSTHRKPRVAILSTGDELVTLDSIDAALAGRKVIASNGYALSALAGHAGAEVQPVGLLPDDAAALASAFAALRASDVILTTGGVSVGAFDYARTAFERAGGRVHFWRVRMRPGSQLTFGTLGACRWIGLPGNPASAVVGFEVCVRPLLRRLAGHGRLFPGLRRATLAEDLAVGVAGATFFLRGRVESDDGQLVARLSGRQGSHVQSGIARANALLVVREGTAALSAGSAVEVLMLGEERWVSEAPW